MLSQYDDAEGEHGEHEADAYDWSLRLRLRRASLFLGPIVFGSEAGNHISAYILRPVVITLVPGRIALAGRDDTPRSSNVPSVRGTVWIIC